MLTQSISLLKGIGEKRAQALNKLKVYTVLDLLYFLPSRYLDFSKLFNTATINHGELVALRLKVEERPMVLRPRGGLSIVTAKAGDEWGKIQVVWYNQPYRKNQLEAGDNKVFCGRVDFSKGKKLVNPAIENDLPGILPVYPLVQGLTQSSVLYSVKQAITHIELLEEGLSKKLKEKYGLMGLKEAIKTVHFPNTFKELEEAKRRLAFEDMLIYFLAVAMLKKQNRDKNGIAFKAYGVNEELAGKIPYTLTNAQNRVMDEIKNDMESNKPMNRLLQGDVGSGKTIVAVYALLVALKNDYQAVFMAPTEILAQQHYDLIRGFFGDKVILLSGGLKSREKKEAYEKIEKGDALIVVGTHALIQPGLGFNRLGLIITDEQHRFGVRQRALLANKAGCAADVLVMSATPIPRTLAMLLYGDLDISILDEMPAGRKPVLTRFVPDNKRDDMYGFLLSQVKEKKQAYVVCPLVEQSDIMQIHSAEEIYSELKKKYPFVKFALLHGKMSSLKKQETIDSYRKGETDVLVSTTVVEVGVDVENATIMIIENAERFGLAQLHQLRGRVGRGKNKSYCFLLSSSKSENVKDRLSIMTKTNDGFLIANKDLEIRGPGEFLGTRQHGDIQEFTLNMDILLQAKDAASFLLEEGETEENEAVFNKAKEIYNTRLAYIANN